MRDAAIAHLLLSVGALSALFALLAVFDQSWELVFAWLGVGLLVETWDSITGTQAGDGAEPPDLGRVRSLAVVTFLNSVFVPVVALLHAGFLDGYAGVLIAGLVLLSAQYRLTFHDWPGRSSSFTGMPAAWNVVAFYLYAFDATSIAAIPAIGLGMVLGLLPVSWPHPLHSERWRTLTRAVVAVWLMAAAVTVWRGFPASVGSKTVFVLAAAYGLLLTVLAARERQVSAPDPT